jgi:hypothetical protein
MTGHLPGLGTLIHDWSLTWVGYTYSLLVTYLGWLHIYMTGHLPRLATLLHDWSLTWVGYTYT